MAFGILLGQIAIIFLEVMLGAVGVWCGIITDRDSKFLSNFVMKLLLPFNMLAGAAVTGGGELTRQAAIAFCILLVFFIATSYLCRGISRLCGDTPGRTAVCACMGSLPNCGFIGMPLACALLGNEVGTVYGAVAMAAYNVWFFTDITCLFRPGEKVQWKSFVTPTNLATVAMLVMLATGWQLPGTLQTFCKAVGGCTTPMALMIVGVMLGSNSWLALLREKFLYRITLLRGVVFPLVFMAVVYFLPLPNTLKVGMCVFACAPAGSLGAVLAKQTGIEEVLASQSVAHSTLCMLVTVPVMLMLAGTLFPLG